jgi:general secretion pathway protein D
MTRTARRTLGRGLGGLAAALLAAWLFLTPGALPGGMPSDVPGWAIGEEEPAVISIKEETAIEDFLKAVGKKVGGKPIVWDPSTKLIKDKKIIGSLDLKAPPSQLFDLVRALLTFYDLAMVPIGPQGYEVYLVMDAKQQGAIVKLKPRTIDLNEGNLALYESQDGLFVSTNIRVENMTSLRDARTALTKITTQNLGNVTEVPASRSFVVTDFAPNVVAIWRLLKQLDIKPTGRVVTSAYVKLEHALADEIEPILTDLFTGRERVALNRPNQGQPQGGGTDVEEDPEPRIIPDVRTNQLIIYGTQDDIKAIQEVVAHLDVPVYIVNSRVHVVQLKNLEAEDTAAVLQQLIDATTIFGVSAGAGLSGSSRSSAGTSGRAPGVRPAGASGEVASPDQEEKPAVVADVKSNSLIIAASKRQWEELENVIKLIDIKKAQVLIEAALIELTLDDSFRLAIELGMSTEQGLTKPGIGPWGFTSFGQTVMADKDGDTFLTDRIPPFVDSATNAIPSGLVGGIFAMGQVPLIFNIVNSITRSRVLQLPSLVAADNEEAVIEVKDEQPTTSNTTTTGGTQTGGFSSFQEAGTVLQISPHIADQNYLLLNIRMSVSAFSGESRVLAGGTVIPPPRTTRILQTVVSVPDRHTVVLGGLMGTSETSTIDKTPWVGDIPILGNLFKSTNKGSRQTSLFLFVTPTIMDGMSADDVLDRESCLRKQKADELIGYTDIYNAQFKGCDMQSCGGATLPTYPAGVGDHAPHTPASAGPPAIGEPMLGVGAGAVRGSGSSSDCPDGRCGLEASRFLGVSKDRLAAEAAHRRAALKNAAPAKPAGSR